MNNLIVLILFIIFGMIYWGLSHFKNQRRIQQNKSMIRFFSMYAQLDNTEELIVRCDNMEDPLTKSINIVTHLI